MLTRLNLQQNIGQNFIFFEECLLVKLITMMIIDFIKKFVQILIILHHDRYKYISKNLKIFILNLETLKFGILFVLQF